MYNTAAVSTRNLNIICAVTMITVDFNCCLFIPIDSLHGFLLFLKSSTAFFPPLLFFC